MWLTSHGLLIFRALELLMCLYFRASFLQLTSLQPFTKHRLLCS